MSEPLLSVRDLQTYFRTDESLIRAVDGVSFELAAGETVCLVGESGSGKTVTCESLTGLIPMPPGEIVDGSVRFDGRELVGLNENELRSLRGRRISYVFQNPQNALDPVYSIGEQLIETIERVTARSGERARTQAITLLEDVGIPTPSSRLDEYPHQFSGGMQQRVLLAMALAGDPDLLVADEPTTAVDVTIEAGIVKLLRELQNERGMAILFVTHDLGVVAEIADRVVVLYGGKVMERGDVDDIFDRPAHPYTRALFRCLPGYGERLKPIGGDPVDAASPPEGCRFHPRCSHAVEKCRGGENPAMHEVRSNQTAACIYYSSGYDAAELNEPDGAGPGEHP